MTNKLVIFKYEITLQDRTRIFLPKDFRILAFQAQTVALPIRVDEGISTESFTSRTGLFIWVLHDSVAEPDNTWHKVCFRLIATGQPIDTPLGDYIGTTQVPPFVWHLFQEKRKA